MQKKTKVIILIFLIALIIRIIFVFSTPIKWWDEAVYADLGYDLSKNPLHYSFDGKWSDFVPAGDWPKAGFRAPLLPYFLSIFYLLKLDFLVEFLIPFIGALSVVLVYLLGEKMFNEKIAFYSSIFLALVPIHVYYSGRILTDVLSTFLILLSIYSFWKGFEEGEKKYKVLFGFFLALSILARYTSLWVAPVFLFYFLIKKKSLSFLKDKYLWLSILIFFIVLSPWFLYSNSEYKNPIGAFIHGAKAASYWGGVQPWYFFFQYSWNMFSIITIIFLFSLLYLLYKKDFIKKEIYFLLILIVFFFLMASLMPHKEDRFLLPITPAICLISGFFIEKIRYHKLVFSFLVIFLLISLFLSFNYTYKNSYTESNLCFLKANEFLKNTQDGLVVTDSSPIVYYYSKKETFYYPNPWTPDSAQNPAYKYFLLSDYDMSPKYLNIKNDLDSNLEEVFNCSNTIVYKNL